MTPKKASKKISKAPVFTEVEIELLTRFTSGMFYCEPGSPGEEAARTLAARGYVKFHEPLLPFMRNQPSYWSLTDKGWTEHKKRSSA